ncbi:MAG: hypothetical protein OEY03_06280 [Rhizobacter sp.]|nr:hypothetical protein [Rhizobacter sp.]
MNGQVQRDQEQFAEEEFLAVAQQSLDRLIDRVHATRPLARLRRGALEDMRHHGDDKIVLGRKVMRLRAARNTGGITDIGRAQTRSPWRLRLCFDGRPTSSLDCPEVMCLAVRECSGQPQAKPGG